MTEVFSHRTLDRQARRVAARGKPKRWPVGVGLLVAASTSLTLWAAIAWLIVEAF